MKKIVLFGDSIAAGVIDGNPSSVLDNFILDDLKKKNNEEFAIVNLGQKGNGTLEAKDRVEEAEAENPDFVVVNVGVNDAINIKNNIYEYHKNLVEIFKKFPKKKIIFLGISYVDSSTKKQADQEIIQVYIQVAKDLAKYIGIKYIDVYYYMTFFVSPETFLQKDGLHPSIEGYHLLSNLIVDSINERLEK